MKLYTQTMATDNNERYDIAFAGECLEGHDPAAVREAMGKLFKADDATLERLFCGTRQRIKRNCDKATALKYQKSLAAAGAKAIITLATAASPALEPVASPAPEQVVSEESDDGDLTLLPGGSDILRPDERTQHQEAALDLSHISLAETGDRLSEETVDKGPAVNAPNFDVAEPGAQIGPELAQTPSVAPDTSALDIAPVGEDLGAHSSQTSPPVSVSTEHLALADTGSDLLKAEERKVSNEQAPDTSHLALEPSENEPKT
ncbi:hypothetical protein R0135_01645 [Congregibacter variabilis]|uniref:Uncharacterized protein n=1 Tax=Congregibacter variabilis TaxID=3081200 RepID=A0ABZ0I745_9GAMM|nr:hypothetical protein R0135_01645 [Congregibacter sp. IMCC43200]